MTRDEHLKQAKDRALEYCDKGDLANAVSSMVSDLRKHEAFQAPSYDILAQLGIIELMTHSTSKVRAWITGYN